MSLLLSADEAVYKGEGHSNLHHQSFDFDFPVRTWTLSKDSLKAGQNYIDILDASWAPLLMHRTSAGNMLI